MITYRHKIIWNRLRNRLKTEDIEGIKLTGLFITLFFVIGFFGYSILNVISEGYETEKRLKLLESQLAELELENKILKKERDASLSDTELEARYRELGYKKPGETVFIVYKNNSVITVTPTPTPQPDEGDSSRMDNWQKWLIKIFK